MSPRIAFAACAVFLFAACPKAPLKSEQSGHQASPDPKLGPQVRSLSQQAEALLRQQDDRVWLNWTEGKPLELTRTYEAVPALFSVESIQKIERLRQQTKEPREIRALTNLHVHFVGEYLSHELSELTEAIANLHASMMFTVDGKEYAYRDLDRILANEKSAPRRRALYEAATPLVDRLSQSLRRKEEKTQELLQQLGYPSYEAFGSELRQADLTQLGFLADEVLQVTEEPYKEVLRRLSQKELGIPFGELRRADMARLFRPRGVDAFFPKEGLLTRGEATFKGLGVDFSSLPNIKIDARELPTKNPRPLTVAIVVPSDVRVSLKPAGGARDQANVMHELGHAMHFGFTQEKRFELAKLGASAVADAFAFLFEDLLEDPLWLEEQAGLSGEKLAQYLADSSAHKLFLIRRAAGRLLYELQLHRAGPADAKALYSTLLSRTYGVAFTAEDDARFLVEPEDFYASADTFRAWCLAGQIQGQLKARFGPSWWHQRAAGDFLKFLWAKGNALTAPELARLAGEDAIKPDVLLLRLGTTLKLPITVHANAPDAGVPVSVDARDGGRPSDGGSGPTDAGY